MVITMPQVYTGTFMELKPNKNEEVHRKVDFINEMGDSLERQTFIYKFSVNGSTAVSKTVRGGSNPSTCAKKIYRG